jgi:hypothetical protein
VANLHHKDEKEWSVTEIIKKNVASYIRSPLILIFISLLLFKIARIFGLLNGKIQRILEHKIVEKARQEHGIGGILWERTKKAIAMGSIGMNESVDCNKSMGGIVNGIGGIVKIWTPSGKAIHVKIGTDHTDNCIVNAGYISLDL